MHVLDDIANRIERRVLESHGDVLNALFAHIDRKIRIMEAVADKCSYAAALGDYTGAIIMAHHMRKHIDDMYRVESEETERLFSRLNDYERRARAVRVGMYSSVCQNCVACRSRRKKWPSHVQFKDNAPLDWSKMPGCNYVPPETPVDNSYDNKISFAGIAPLLQPCPRKVWYPT
jgi:hypothetical protein